MKMINNLKGLHKGIFYFTLIIIPWHSTYSAETVEEIAASQVNATEAKLGEFCFNEICSNNQFCDITYVCKCLPGYRVSNNECVPYAGENERCNHRSDCIENLICFRGICRKPTINDDFAMLAKICLGITVITIIVAVFSSLLKCLIKFDNANSRALRRQNDSSNSNFTPAMQHYPAYNPRQLYDTREEKPPSYEECIRSSEPPPYVISSSHPPVLPIENSVTQPVNMTNTDPQNETPLSIQNLNQKTNPK